MSRQRPQSAKILIISLGCAKNLVDTEVMCGGLATAGFTLTNVPEAADVILINTCSFIADARAEAEEEIQAALAWREQQPHRRLAVAGCLPQRDLGAARAQFPQVDLFLGLDDVPHAAKLIAGLLGGRGDVTGATDSYPMPTYVYDHITPRLQLTPPNYAYVKIAEGCNHHCRFCAIPRIRGHRRSRPMPSIVEECRMLLGQGVHELNLIAQDTTCYGRDRDDGASLPRLLHACDTFDGEFWIRLLYAHPRFFSDDVMAAFQDCQHLLPYIEMPLQHISTNVLKAMGRGMAGDATRRLMDRLRAEIPEVAVRTTFLVGYPGETEADFAELLEYVQGYRFDRIGVFTFSPEPETPAATITDGLVPPAEAEARKQQLLEVQSQISAENNQQLIGQTVTVIVDTPVSEDEFSGRTYADAPEVDNRVFFRGRADALAAGFVQVRIEEVDAYDLQGVQED